MAANPNSNLVFDFPDPSPRFEFDESPTTGFGFGNNNNSKKGRGKKFGKLGLGKGSKVGKKLGGSGNNHDGGGSPSKHSLGSISSGNTATTTSLGASLDTSFGSSSAATSRAHSNSISPLKSRNNSGDIAAGPVPHFDLMPGQQQQQPQQGYFQSSSSPAKLNLPARPAPLNPSSSSLSNSSPKQQFSLGQQANANQQTLPKNHARHPSNASASGYISEVSEFSFDRVTVTTNETGMTGHSSNVSWNFLDEGVMTAINDATGGGQRGDNNNSNNNNSKFVPYTGDSAAITTNNGNGNSSAPQNQRPSHHQQNQSTSTFSNVSLSDDDETDDIPFTGIVDSNQSVVSEISERTGGALEGGGNGSNAVKALLRDGMESAQRRHRHRGLSPDSRTSNNNNNLSPERRTNITVVNSQSKNLTMIKEDKKCDGSPSRNTHSTARSTASGSNGGRTGNNFLGDIKSTYASFKQRRNDTVNNSNNNNINGNGNNNNNMGNKDTNNNKPPTILQSIIEDVQFCGLYLCGIDTTQANANGYNATKSAYEEAMKKKKEERKQETEDTFLGRVISCGGGGGINNEVPGCCGVVDF